MARSTKHDWCTKEAPCDFDDNTSYCVHRECRDEMRRRYGELQEISQAAYHLLGVYKPPAFAPGAFLKAWRKLDDLVSERNR